MPPETLSLRATLTLVLLAGLAAGGAPAHAARPFVTDDARIVDPGGCQIETFSKRQSRLNEREFWFLPACNPTGRVELTLGRIQVDGNTPGDNRANLVQAKMLVKPLVTNGSGYAFSVGATRVTPFQAPHATNPYLNAIGSFSFADDRVVVHANLGAVADRQLDMTRGTWGLGAEVALNRRLYGIVEGYGQRADKPTRHIGLRVWIVPDRVQVDATVGRQNSGPPERAFRTVGLRILF